MAKCTGIRCPMQHGYNVNECNHTDCPYRTEPITNADRIRAMSDEELAKVPSRFGYSCVFPQKECGESDTCEKCLLEWLKQPAE